MKRARLTKCNFEMLEGRLLMSTAPSPLTTSTNWSGYAVVETANDTVGAVSGAWKVPAVTGTNRAYSADWVGIDGYSSNTVEQLGTESDTLATSKHDGTPQYYAWFEMYPAYPWIIPDTVKPGDAVTASVQFIGSSHTQYTATGNTRTDVYTGNTITTTTALNDNFQLTIADAAQKWSFTITQSMAYQSDLRNSAEWIVEAPSNGNNVLTLASFGSVTFTGAQATINGVSTAIGSNPSATVDSKGNATTSGWVAIDMTISRKKVIAATSVLNAAGNSFTVDYGAQTPAAPAAAAPAASVLSDASVSSLDLQAVFSNAALSD